MPDKINANPEPTRNDLTPPIVVCYLKRNEDDHPEREALAREIVDYLASEFGIEPRLVNLKDQGEGMEDREFRGIVIGAGGDGMLIGSTYSFPNPENHFLLVGAPGKSTAFYAQSDHRQFRQDLRKVIEQKYHILAATRIRIRATDGSYVSPNILNEVAIKESNTGQMFRYDLEITGQDIYKRSNGGCSTIIFATPIGSTAWGLAAGGSIIYGKDSKLVAITPESPVNAIKADPLNMANVERDRLSFLAPGIFPLGISFVFKPLVDAVLIKDGRWWSNDSFPANTEFTIEAGDPIKFIRMKERGFYRPI
jgi:NAD kinase